MKKIFIYVGHSNWGKSFALRILTNGSSQRKITTIANERFWVRKMSNDDASQGLLNFVRTIPNSSYSNFILAYCPNHNRDETARAILNELAQQNNELYFFVQEEKFTRPHTRITAEEIQLLNEIGTIEVLNGRNEDIVRAEAFQNFIIENL